MQETFQVLDQKLYEEFMPIGSFESYESFDDAQQKRKVAMEKFFLDGENPRLEYPKIDLEKNRLRESDLLLLKDKVLSQESNETVKNVYRWKINEKIAELRLIRAAGEGDMRRFKKYSEFIYGKPSLELVGYTINVVRAKAEKLSHSEEPKIVEAAKGLLEVLPEELAQAQFISLPSPDSIERVRAASMNMLGDLVLIDDKASLSSDEIVDSFNQMFQEDELDGWTAVKDPGRAKISASQESRTVKVPVDKTATGKKLKQLGLHEIKTHAARRNNGERSRLMLLGLGLDRYEGGEEGVATMREQGLDDTIDSYSGWEGMLAIGLAYGIDGQPRDFKQVFTIMEKYFELDQYAPKDPERQVKPPRELAWERCVRTFRGTDCQTEGVCYTKDIIYERGNIGVWELVGKNPDEMMRFQVGKYDPTNARHILVLETLGITDTDLLE